MSLHYTTSPDQVSVVATINRPRRPDQHVKIDGRTMAVRDSDLLDMGTMRTEGEPTTIAVIVGDRSSGIALSHEMSPADARQFAQALLKAVDEEEGVRD